MDTLEVDKQKRLGQIESERFCQLVQSLGSDTLKEMARAGPDTQVTPDFLSELHSSEIELGPLIFPHRSAQKSGLMFESGPWLSPVDQVTSQQPIRT